MPANINWYWPDRVLLARFYNHVTSEDVRELYIKALEMSESVDSPLIHLIVNINDVESFPKSISTYKDMFSRKAVNSGWILLVGNNIIMQLFGVIITNLMKLHFKHVRTLDEALEFIVDRDPDWDLEDVLDLTIPYRELL